MPSAVWEINIVWSLDSSDPLSFMKSYSAGICSMSDGTLGLSRCRWTLSNCRMITCLMAPFPRRHAAAALAGVVLRSASPIRAAATSATRSALT